MILAFCLNLLYNCVQRFESRDSDGNEKNITIANNVDDSHNKMKRDSKLDANNEMLDRHKFMNKTDHAPKVKAWNTKAEGADGSKHSKWTSKTIIRTTRKSADSECLCPHKLREECPEGCPNPVTMFGNNQKRSKSLSSTTQTSS